MSQALGDGSVEELAERLMLGWRVRCAIERARWELTSGSRAASLCGAAALTIVGGFPATELATSIRRWRAKAGSEDDQRDALLCLAESAVEAAADLFGDFRPRGLEVFLAAMAAESEASDDSGRLDVDPVTGCADRRVLDRDLAAALAAAEISGDDVAVAVMELEEPARPWLYLLRPGEVPPPEPEHSIVGLVENVRRAVGSAGTVYQIGEEKLAVVAVGTNRNEMGELVLFATCLHGPGFIWGTSSLHRAGPATAGDTEVLVMLAEADMVVRRRDLAEASTAVVRKRVMSVAGPIAAAAVLVVAATVGLSSPQVQGPGTQALPASLGSGPAQPAPRNGPPTPPSNSTPPPSTPPSGNVTVSAPVSTTSTPGPHAPSAPPPSPPAPPHAPPPPTPQPKTAPGHSGLAPGHAGGHGSGKHA